MFFFGNDHPFFIHVWQKFMKFWNLVFLTLCKSSLHHLDHSPPGFWCHASWQCKQMISYTFDGLIALTCNIFHHFFVGVALTNCGHVSLYHWSRVPRLSFLNNDNTQLQEKHNNEKWGKRKSWEKFRMSCNRWKCYKRDKIVVIYFSIFVCNFHIFWL